MHLFVIRHGQSHVNLPDWNEGFVDAGLTALGARQAQALAGWLAARVTFDALYTSTMLRARETAQYITQVSDIAAQADDRLREFGNCYADGRPVPLDGGDSIEYPADWWGTDYPNRRISPQGESWMLFRARVSAFIDEVVMQYGARDPQAVVGVVCHGGVIEAVFDHAFNVGPHRHTEIWNHNTGVMYLEYRAHSAHQDWRLHGQNLVYHLIGADNGADLLGGPLLHRAQRVE